MQFAVFHLRSRSLLRGTVCVVSSLAMSVPLSGFPDIQPSPALILPCLLALFGTFDTVRCLQLRWSFYHGGVLLLLYMDLMVLILVFFLLLYPYARWLL
jgi:hypothetical protein